MKDEFEILFKKALDEVRVEPPKRVWEGIEGHFRRRARVRRLWYAAGSVAAAVALLLGVSLLLEEKGSMEPARVERVAMAGMEPEKAEVVALAGGRLEFPAMEQRGGERVAVPAGTVTEGLSEPLRGELKGDAGRMETRELVIPLVDGSAVETMAKYARVLRAEEKGREGIHEETAEKNNEAKVKEAVMAPEGKDGAEKGARKERFSVSGYVSPGYTSGSYEQTNANSRTAQFSSDQMSGLVNVAGGISFAVKPGKRLSIETGVGYSRMGQRTEGLPVYAPASTMKDESTGKLVKTVLVATPLGNVRSEAEATVYTMDANVALRDGEDTEGDIEQQFDAVEVPLLVRYQLNNNRLKFSVVGGFGASFVVRNETFVNYDGQRESMGETEDVRRFNVSTSLGVGMEYPITRALYFRVEPGFKYYLRSLSKAEGVRFRPYSFTFSTGIGINF